MTSYVNLYIGPKEDMSRSGRDRFERAILKEVNALRSPAGLAKHYSVEVKVKSKENKCVYKTEVRAQTINNWLNMYEDLIRKELESGDGLRGEYSSPEERNPTIIRILSKLVPIYINTEDTTKLVDR